MERGLGVGSGMNPPGRGGLEDRMFARDYEHIRCHRCDARLFDTDGLLAAPEDQRVGVLIKCWRCKAINVVYLAPAEADEEDVHYSEQ